MSDARLDLLRAYCAKNQESGTLDSWLPHTGARISVVIPAYQEESYIGYTIESLGMIEDPIAIIVADNDSTDRTRQVVTSKARTIRWPVFTVTCLKKGPVHARKRAMDEVIAQYLAHDPQARQRHYIAMIDADTTVPKNWVRAILTTFERTGAAAVGGIHDAPQWIDDMIEHRTRIRSFFCDLPRIAFWLTEHGYVQAQTKGANAAIEVASYAEIGGARQPVDETNKYVKGSDRLFGQALRARARTVAFLPVMTTSSPRRSLFSLLRGKDLAYYSSMEHWVDCREKEEHMVATLISLLSKDEWMRNMRDRERMYLEHSIVMPILRKEMSVDYLERLTGPDHPMFESIADAIRSHDADISSPLTEHARPIVERFSEPFFEICRSCMART